MPLFFVISGYCIHRPEVRRRKADPASRLNLSNYAVRRAWRIYPVLLTALLLTFAMDRVTTAFVPPDRPLNASWFCFAANLGSLQNIIAPTYGTNYPLWTLAVETHFYLVYPLFLLVVTRLGMVIAASIVFALSSACWLIFQRLGVGVVIFVPYWFAWVVGAYVAEAEAGFVRVPRRLMSVLAILSLGIAVTFDRWKGMCIASTPIVYSVLAVPFALLLLYAIRFPGARIWKSLLGRSTAAIGLFSYSLYATHVPLLIMYRALLQDGRQSMAFWAVLPGTIIAIGVGYAVYLVIERRVLVVPQRKLDEVRK